MSIGISTASFYPELTETALRVCGEQGVPCTEIFINAPSEIEPPFVRELARIKQAYGTKVLSIHPFTAAIEGYMLFSAYERRFIDAMDFYMRYAEAAATLGAKYIVLHGDRTPTPVLSCAEYTERFLQLNLRMQTLGVTLTQENVNLYSASKPDFIRGMRKYSGDTISFTFDVKQAVRSGHTPLQLLEAMGEKIVHVHVSDHTDGADCLLPGRGRYDFGALFDRLDGQGYDGDYVIEVYNAAYQSYDELVGSMRYLHSVYDR